MTVINPHPRVKSTSFTSRPLPSGSIRSISKIVITLEAHATYSLAKARVASNLYGIIPLCIRPIIGVAVVCPAKGNGIINFKLLSRGRTVNGGFVRGLVCLLRWLWWLARFHRYRPINILGHPIPATLRGRKFYYRAYHKHTRIITTARRPLNSKGKICCFVR